MEIHDHLVALTTDNLRLLEELYTTFQQNPKELSSEWIKYFQEFERTSDGKKLPRKKYEGITDTDLTVEKWLEFPGRALLLIQTYRKQGHLAASLDPLSLNKPRKDLLAIERFGIGQKELDRKIQYNAADEQHEYTLRAVIEHLDKIYCGTTGYEFLYISDDEKRNWFLKNLEKPQQSPPDKEKLIELYNSIYRADSFERFLATRFPGKKRFSLEGADSLIPALLEAIEFAGEHSIRQVVIGMAHRGRLNVLHNVLDKDLPSMLAEFDENIPDFFVNGDVKYHLGYSIDKLTGANEKVHVSLAFNPSHLEIINTIVLGSVRARQDRLSNGKRSHELPVLIHGDAAFSGQGINYEILNMSSLPAYNTGGSLHIVVNNQIGFTTDPEDGRSTHYVTDLARMLDIPVIHVNGDDPVAVIRAVRLALNWRQRFKTDVFVDLIAYRRPGHNETDDPFITQPVMYDRITNLPRLTQIFEERLLAEGVSKSDLDKQRDLIDKHLDDGYKMFRENNIPVRIKPGNNDWLHLKRYDPASRPDTAVSMQTLSDIVTTVTKLPENFTPHDRILKILEVRKESTKGEKNIDWGMAEILAYGSLLKDGISVRLAGQDSRRGTFSHRHGILFDRTTGNSWSPLSNLTTENTRFDLYNSLLSEVAALGFEYGYSTASPHILTIWEAQFGDFVNGAQVVIDQFIASSEAKWGKMSGLVMFLPHGYEGMGPEHSSARPERFLQLCALNNIQVVNPTSPAQLFHLLRRQMLRNFRKPLIVFTPKSLLRLSASLSSINDFSSGSFKEIIDDDTISDASSVKRVIFCSGKIYYELIKEKADKNVSEIAIVRIEQFYPWSPHPISELIKKYNKAEEFAWVQEEPMNQGAWTFMRNRIRSAVSMEKRVVYFGRVPSSSPATGYASVHKKEQTRILQASLNLQFRAPDTNFFCELWV